MPWAFFKSHIVEHSPPPPTSRCGQDSHGQYWNPWRIIMVDRDTGFSVHFENEQTLFFSFLYIIWLLKIALEAMLEEIVFMSPLPDFFYTSMSLWSSLHQITFLLRHHLMSATIWCHVATSQPNLCLRKELWTLWAIIQHQHRWLSNVITKATVKLCKQTNKQ